MKLFKITLFISLLFLSVIVKAQTWQWLSASTNTLANSIPGKIVSDALGYTYSTGTFSNTFIVAPTMSLTSAGNKDIYVIKRDPNGIAIWAKRFGSTLEDEATGIALDHSGNIILGGKFSQTMAMGATLLSSNGGFDAFIAKLDNTGNTIWAKSFGGTSSGNWDAVYALATDTLNNIYATGLFFGNVSLASGITISSAGPYSDFFMLKMDAAGNYNWARKGISITGGFDYSEGLTIKVSHDQNHVIAGGTFRGKEFIFGVDSLLSPGNTAADSYIMSVNAATGTTHFIKAITGAGYTEVADLDVDGLDNIYVTGYCESNTFTSPATIINNTGTYNIFVFKYNSAGAFIWSTALGNSTYAHESTSILVNHHNKVLISGYFSHHLQNGSFLITGYGMFLAVLDTNKTALSLDKATTSLASNIYNRYMSIDTADNVYFNGSLYNGVSTFGTITYTATGNQLFNAKFGNPTSIPTNLHAANALNGVSIYPNPATDVLIISGKNIERVELKDVWGREMISDTGKDKERYELAISNLSEGVYFICVRDNTGKQQQKKIVISR